MIPEPIRALAQARPGAGRWAALMYHELSVSGRRLAESSPGYAVYCVDRDAFGAQMDALAGAGLHGAALGEAFARHDGRTVAITFDDGCETDCLEAAPILRERGFGATFYVIAAFLGRRGYMTPAQLRELAAAGFQIGSHSLTHRMLTTLSPDDVERDLRESRARLEEVTGAPVEHFSCPHGRWSAVVAAAARRAGFQTVSTSQVGLNTPDTPPSRLRRIAVRRGADAGAVAALARGQDLHRAIGRDAALAAGKRLLGEDGYAALRERLLRRLRGS